MSNARNLASILGTNITLPSSSIADSSITAAKIASDAVTHTKIHALGSMLHDWDNSVASASATGYRTVSKTFVLPSDSTLEQSWANMCSLTFFGYISAGSYWYTWRLFDVTDNRVVQPITGPSS